jgi:hypothetical protein
MDADPAITDEPLKFDLMQPSQLTGAAKGNALLLKKGDRKLSAEVCFTDLQGVGQVNYDFH